MSSALSDATVEVSLATTDEATQKIAQDLRDSLQTVSQITHLLASNIELDEGGKLLAQRVVSAVECIDSLFNGLGTVSALESEKLKTGNLNIESADALGNLERAIGVSSMPVSAFGETEMEQLPVVERIQKLRNTIARIQQELANG